MEENSIEKYSVNFCFKEQEILERISVLGKLEDGDKDILGHLAIKMGDAMDSKDTIEEERIYDAYKCALKRIANKLDITERSAKNYLTLDQFKRNIQKKVGE